MVDLQPACVQGAPVSGSRACVALEHLGQEHRVLGRHEQRGVQQVGDLGHGKAIVDQPRTVVPDACEGARPRSRRDRRLQVGPCIDVELGGNRLVG